MEKLLLGPAGGADIGGVKPDFWANRVPVRRGEQFQHKLCRTLQRPPIRLQILQVSDASGGNT